MGCLVRYAEPLGCVNGLNIECELGLHVLPELEVLNFIHLIQVLLRGALAQPALHVAAQFQPGQQSELLLVHMLAGAESVLATHIVLAPAQLNEGLVGLSLQLCLINSGLETDNPLQLPHVLLYLQAAQGLDLLGVVVRGGVGFLVAGRSVWTAPE